MYEDLETRFIYLTLIPEQIPTGEEFINVTYKDLLEKVNLEIEDKYLDKVYKDFLSFIKDFYSKVEVNKEERLWDLFSENVDDETIYLRFTNVMKHWKDRR